MTRIIFCLLVPCAVLVAACGSAHEPRSDGGATDAATSCGTGQAYLYPGCGSGGDVTIVAGCYTPCAGPSDTSCGDGLACRRTDINPCVCSAGEPCCAACGAEAWVCLPPAEPMECDGAAYCDCTGGCEALVDLSTGCICNCDAPFNCAGETCDCICGGATYMGCAAAGSCPNAEITCTGCTAILVDGCPVCPC